MTLEDILNKRFERATVGGYRADNVNEFMERLTQYIQQVEQEKKDLQNKLIVLADKLEEYRSDEESMRSALVGAQKLGDTIVKESKEKSGIMLESATREAEQIVNAAKNNAVNIARDATANLDMETQSLLKMQREAAQFRKKLQSMYQQQMDLISLLPQSAGAYNPSIDENLPTLPEPLTSNIGRQRQAKKERLEESSAPQGFKRAELGEDLEAKEAPKPTGEQKPESDFKPLQFGAGYRVTTEE